LGLAHPRKLIGGGQARFYKASAYRLRVQRPGTIVRFAIDGEVYHLEGEMVVEVHRGLGRLLSPQNHYGSPFRLGPDRKVVA
jgi:hypothetical protein